jgi:hypothetical protein
VIIYGNSGRRNRIELLCIAGRIISDHYVVIVEAEWEENFFVPQVEISVLLCGNNGRRIGRELLFTASIIISVIIF